MDERDKEKSFEEEYNSLMSNILCLTIGKQDAFPTIHKIFCLPSEIYSNYMSFLFSMVNSHYYQSQNILGISSFKIDFLAPKLCRYFVFYSKFILISNYISNQSFIVESSLFDFYKYSVFYSRVYFYPNFILSQYFSIDYFNQKSTQLRARLIL